MNRFFYGWVIVAVWFITIFWTLGARFSFGIFYVAILDEYGWSRAETAGAFSVAMLTHALVAPVSGYLVDRFGPRRLFHCGAVFLAFGLYAASRTASITELYVYRCPDRDGSERAVLRPAHGCSVQVVQA